MIFVQSEEMAVVGKGCSVLCLLVYLDNGFENLLRHGPTMLPSKEL